MGDYNSLLYLSLSLCRYILEFVLQIVKIRFCYLTVFKNKILFTKSIFVKSSILDDFPIIWDL